LDLAEVEACDLAAVLDDEFFLKNARVAVKY
jgi:hypothetical protein